MKNFLKRHRCDCLSRIQFEIAKKYEVFQNVKNERSYQIGQPFIGINR